MSLDLDKLRKPTTKYFNSFVLVSGFDSDRLIKEADDIVTKHGDKIASVQYIPTRSNGGGAEFGIDEIEQILIRLKPGAKLQ